MQHDELEEHCAEVADALRRGVDVVPFLGAGVNLAGRGEGVTFNANGANLPSGGELAEYLAGVFGYPLPTQCAENFCPDPQRTRPAPDLLKVSQYAVASQSEVDLYAELGTVFGSASYRPTVAHRFLAGLFDLIEERRAERAAADASGRKLPPHALFLTTNYDDALERALGDREFDVVWYDSRTRSESGSGSRWWHLAHGAATAEPIPISNKDDPGRFDDRPVVVKVHGAVDSNGRWDDSFVISEDHYSEYLALTPEESLPLGLKERLLASRLLFLGYSLTDWNLRVLLHRIRSEQRVGTRSWAVQLGATTVDLELWDDRNVKVLDVDLARYVQTLAWTLHMMSPV